MRHALPIGHGNGPKRYLQALALVHQYRGDAHNDHASVDQFPVRGRAMNLVNSLRIRRSISSERSSVLSLA